MSVGQSLTSALSKDKSLVAMAPPSSSDRQTVQVYQVTASSCQLQLTLTHKSAGPLMDLAFCGNSSVLARFGTSQVIVWDLERGVVGQTLNIRDEESFLGLATPADDVYYVLVRHGTDKLVVHEYDVSSGKLQRKIKSGRWEESAQAIQDDENVTLLSLCASANHLVVQTSPGSLRVMDSQTGKKKGKIKAGKGSGVFFSNMILEGDKLAGTTNAGGTSVYDILSCKESLQVPPPATSSSTSSSAVKSLHLESDILLVDGTVVSMEGGTITTLKSTHPFFAFLAGSRAVALVYQKRSGCKAKWVELSDGVEETTDLDAEKDDESQKDAAGSSKSPASSSKRKAAAEPMILGPGQAGSEPAPPVKKAKADDSMQVDSQEEKGELDMTIAERLQKLNQALQEEDEEDDDENDDLAGTSGLSKPFKPKQATTESLKELLTQALQASEDSMLELALGVRDVKVITSTLKELEPALVVVLLGKLTSRLAANPLRAESLAKWLSYCLKYGSFHQQHLAPLRNLMHERIESFPDLLRLEGRLSLMCDVE